MNPPGDDAVMLEIGSVTRAHGLRGEVVLQLVTNRLERVEPGSVLNVAGRELTVESSRRDRDRWLVRFAGVDDRAAAEALRGRVTATPLDDPDELWVHDLVGRRVMDGDVDRGVVTAVQENPASDLMVLEGGELVPLVFVTGLADGVVDVEVPEGLFELGAGDG